jgi:GNAT superfamily N-acetyltransferase
MNLQEADRHFNEQIKNAFSNTVVERILDYEQSVHDEVLPNTYWLGLIAVAKNARGRGIGSALIKHVIQQCKEDSTVDNIMLDTANIRNIDLYERLGFKATVIKAFDEDFCQTVMAYSLK